MLTIRLNKDLVNVNECMQTFECYVAKLNEGRGCLVESYNIRCYTIQIISTWVIERQKRDAITQLQDFSVNRTIDYLRK